MFVLTYALNMEKVPGESLGQTVQKVRNGSEAVAECPGRELKGT